MPRFGINTAILANTPTEFDWTGRDGEIVVESAGTTTVERYARTKFVPLSVDATITGDGSFIFTTTATKLRITSTANAEVIASPFRG